MLLPRIPSSSLSCWLASVCVVVLHLLCGTQASSMWKDAEPKLISPDSYSNFRSFRGEHFGSLTLSPSQRLLLVGAQNSFFLLDLDQPLGSPQSVRNYTWSSESLTIENCLMKGVERWECQNFIEVLQPNPADDNKLFVCGTNAQTPKCRYFSNESLIDYEESDGTFICPYNPKQEGTAIFAGGNLYTGAARDYTARDSVIFRSQGIDNVLTTKAMDSKWLKIPAFVKSFDVGDWVLFFFREVAVEYTSGDGVYSRVAKVCKSDQGGEWISNGQWTTFQKIRLNCSFSGAFPFYFNFLQDVHMVTTENDTLFYGVFTTGSHEIPGSAVCVFSLKTIKTIMNEGEFKEQQGGAWYPASPPSSYPRPGNCDLDSMSLPSQSAQWITTHPLMHESVPNHGKADPVFDLTRADFRLTQIVAHTQTGLDGDYRVLFLGTDDSKVLKVVLVPTVDGGVHSNLLEEITLRSHDIHEMVVNMEIVPNHEGKDVLIVNTNSSILEVPLQRCTNYTNRCGCTQDPYCVWNVLSNACYEFNGNTFDEQDVKTIQECPDDPPPPTTPAPECICETDAPSTASSERYTLTSTTTSPSTALSSTTIAVPTTTLSTMSSTILDETTEPSPPSTTDDHEVPVKTAEGSHQSSSSSATMGNNIPEGKLTPSLSPSTMGNVIPPLDPNKSFNLMEEGNVLVLVFLILGWILFTFCGMVVLYQCYNQHHKGIYQPTTTDDSILSANMKTKVQKDHLSTPNQNGKVANGIPQEVPWSPPSRATHTPAGRERDSLGPVNGHSLPRRPMPVPTPVVPPAYRSPVSYAHMGSLPSPARINKYNKNNTFNSLDRHRNPPIHNVYVEHPRSHAHPPELYLPFGGVGRAMTAEDRRPSGASDSEMYDDDVWQPRMDGEELV